MLARSLLGLTPFFDILHHKEAPTKVHGVSFVFYYKKYCILPPGIRRVVESV